MASEIARSDLVRLLFEPVEFGVRFPSPRICDLRVRDGKSFDWPINPFVVVNGLPFKFELGGYGCSLQESSPWEELDYANRRCLLRAKPLKPTRHPVQSALDLIESRAVQGLADPPPVGTIRGMLRQAGEFLPESLLPSYRKCISKNELARVRAWVAHHPLCWDEKSHKFQLAVE